MVDEYLTSRCMSPVSFCWSRSRKWESRPRCGIGGSETDIQLQGTLRLYLVVGPWIRVGSLDRDGDERVGEMDIQPQGA